jgi:hypothetical protein
MQHRANANLDQKRRSPIDAKQARLKKRAFLRNRAAALRSGSPYDLNVESRPLWAAFLMAAPYNGWKNDAMAVGSVATTTVCITINSCSPDEARKTRR